MNFKNRGEIGGKRVHKKAHRRNVQVNVNTI